MTLQGSVWRKKARQRASVRATVAGKLAEAWHLYSRADAPNTIARQRDDRATFRIFTRVYSNSGLLLRLRFKFLHHTFDCAEGLGADTKGRHLGDWAMVLYWSWFPFFACRGFYMLPISAESPCPRCELHCFYIHRSLVVIEGRRPIPNLWFHLSDSGLRPSHLAELAPSSNAQTRVH